MKFLVSLFSIFSFCIIATAQSNSYENVVSEINKSCKTQTATFSREAFALLTYFNIEMKEEFKTLINDIDQMIVLMPMQNNNAFYGVALDVLSKSDYKNVDISTHTDVNVKVYVAQHLTSLTEVHAVSARGVMVSFFGKFKYRDIKKLLKSAEEKL